MHNALPIFAAMFFINAASKVQRSRSGPMPMRGELPIAKLRACNQQSLSEKISSKGFAIISNRDLHFVVGFCAAGFLLTVNMVLRFPDFGQTFAALQIFPG
jgi:hypothetical protein